MAGRPRKENRNEILSEKISVALTRPIYDGVVAVAQMTGRSVNAVIVNLISRLGESNAPVIKAFEADRQRHADNLNLDVTTFAVGNAPATNIPNDSI